MAHHTQESDDELDNNRMEELDQPTDMADLPIQINWDAELPPGIVVPRVDIHSILLDFSAVSFLDFSAMRVLQKVVPTDDTDSDHTKEKHTNVMCCIEVFPHGQKSQWQPSNLCEFRSTFPIEND